jgi:hypothetical protein
MVIASFFAARRNGRVDRRFTSAVVAVLLTFGVASAVYSAQPAAAVSGSPCGATINPVACENSQTTGVTPQSVWDINGAGDDTLQGFSTDVSVNAGSSVGFKIDTTLASYTIDIYRLGYYGGNGARLWQSNLAHSAAKHQDPCMTDTKTLLYDCGNWTLSATWAVPSAAVSGVYIARLTGPNGDGSQISFIVRNDASTSDIVYQTSDETWQAYNVYGGSDFYVGTSQLSNSQPRAFKLSYNRPYATRGSQDGRDFLFSNEYPTIRFLERNGYDVSYIADVDADRGGAARLQQHKVFMDVGHDEYWSAAQRQNVEAARDAGVSLMFLSGNEVYWQTRFEPSIDGSNTAYRTLVSYKETWDDAPTDPVTHATSTWRDPRFALYPAGGNPENALTGTAYMANSDDLAIQVTAAQAATRLWRSTGMSTTSTTTLAPHTIGYESDEDLDNGFRPAGLVDLSTTVGSTPQYLTDFGSNVAPGTTTHHITLYRAASGALVFGAGTIQWGWGLDQDHDGDNSNPADARMQQATVNLFADMGVQPSTIMAGLVKTSASTDTTAPTAAITSPAAGTAIANGTQLTVSGTATDAAGKVAGVEVSVDGGTSWHPATGTTSWTYTGIVHGTGASMIRVRATDDSINTSAPVLLSGTTSCPCSLFGNVVPKTPDAGDTSGVELGVRLSSDTDGYITGVRFYKATANTGSHTGSLWSASGSLLATGTFTGESASGWQTLTFATPVAVTAGTSYVASYYAPSGHYSADIRTFYYGGFNSAPLHAPATSPDATTLNGVYSDGHGFPAQSYNGTNYYVDVSFSPSTAVAPTVTAQTPSADASSVATTVTPTVTFSKAMNAATIAFSLKDPSNVSVAGSVSYDAPSKTATFTPSAALSAGTLYSVTVTGSDTSGNALATPATWSFRTAYAGQTGGSCPCTVFADSSVPTTVTENDNGAVQLGVKFTADTDGIVTGVRFYKGPLNTGTHTGTLWSATGTQLATATFTSESSTGWQTVSFATPVSVTAGTAYIASYYTTVGMYSATEGGFATAGVDNFPLHVPAHGGAYIYSTGFPTNSSDANYGVDVVFTVPASLVPSVASSVPAASDTGVAATAPVVATFNTSVIAGTPTITVTPSGGSAIAGTTTLDATHKTLTFTPAAALASGTVYSVSVSGARSLAGTVQSSASTWSFTTSGGTGACPCSLFGTSSTPSQVDSADGGAVTLGTSIVPSVSGYLTSIKFYKASTNTGTHTGTVWSSSGTVLSTVTFTNETASGWQTATFGTPLAVTAGTTYVIGYYAPNGHYSDTPHYFDAAYTSGSMMVPGGTNGVYRYGASGFPTDVYGNTNYWVDVIMTTSLGADTTPPTVTATNPLNAATSVSTSVAPTATFSEPLTAGSVAMTLKDAAGNAVAGATSYASASRTATFTPTAALAAATKYTASATASDAAGNAMLAPTTWTFTTAAAGQPAGTCPCSVWSDSTTPANLSDSDTRSVELGVKFTSDTNGQIIGAQFYKGPNNTGTHTATLWSAAGVQLTTGTFTGESSTGWQSITFAQPVSVTAGTTYVISYHAPLGAFSYDVGAFSSVGVDNTPLHVPAHAALYLYGAGGFPTNSSDANYWVDPVFTTGAPADTTPPVVSAVSVTGSGANATVTWTTDEVSTSKVTYGTTSTALTSTASSGSGTSHSVALTGLVTGTTYYYRVVSADAAGNTATSPTTSAAPLTYSPAFILGSVSDTTAANFAAGTLASTYVPTNLTSAVGVVPATTSPSVVLTGTTNAEFGGTALVTGWVPTATVTGGSVAVANEVATISGASLTTNSSTTYTNGKSLEVRASLSKSQTIGWVGNSNSALKMNFSLNAAGQLIATINDGGSNNVASASLGTPTAGMHRYRIDWTSSTATFFLDDVQVYTHNFNSTNIIIPVAYRPYFTDAATTDTALVLDWVRIGQYSSSAGTFTSRTFDAGQSVTWDALSWVGTVPTGTTMVVKVRTGTTPTLTGAWVTVSTSGASVNTTGRYLQYQVTFTSNTARFVTPTLTSVTAANHH